ncbi:unnamed protein product [Thelazia callipaeda]|uniref:Dual-specificity kinase n=1 Tax=Thelazia callipaeda TaxID=103827 RepID=A0A0N5DC49_THECL|nr:unnamed protein product [Thelazia callipaeda]
MILELSYSDGNFTCKELRDNRHYRSPGSRKLTDIIGVNTGGPGSRRLGEIGHTPEEYAKFKDLVERMLTFDPRERIEPLAAVKHPFFSRKADDSGHMGSNSVSHSRILQAIAVSNNVQPTSRATIVAFTNSYHKCHYCKEHLLSTFVPHRCHILIDCWTGLAVTFTSEASFFSSQLSFRWKLPETVKPFEEELDALYLKARNIYLRLELKRKLAFLFPAMNHREICIFGSLLSRSVLTTGHANLHAPISTPMLPIHYANYSTRFGCRSRLSDQYNHLGGHTQQSPPIKQSIVLKVEV